MTTGRPTGKLRWFTAWAGLTVVLVLGIYVSFLLADHVAQPQSGVDMQSLTELLPTTGVLLPTEDGVVETQLYVLGADGTVGGWAVAAIVALVLLVAGVLSALFLLAVWAIRRRRHRSPNVA